MLTLLGITIPSPLRVFSQETSRRNAARAINVIAQRRSEREEVELFLETLRTQRSAAC